MADVMHVANFFIDCANKGGDTITNMRLNKLLYFAQTHFLHETGNPMFRDSFEAWTYGPVVNTVYQQYKHYKNNTIEDVSEDYSLDCFSDEEYSVLIDVLSIYSMYATSYFVDLTHQPGGAWAKTMNDGGGTIPMELIKKDYEIITVKASKWDKLTSLPVVGRRDPDGFLVLSHEDADDEEWNAYDEV